MKVAIIILNYNGKEPTLDCLESISRLRIINFSLKTIVVDNASTDDSVTVIKQAYPYVDLLVNHTNLGFASGNNVGIRYALKMKSDFLLILNNDTVVEQNLICNLLKTAKQKPIGGIFGPKIYFYPGYETHKQRYTADDLGKVIWYAGGKIDWANVLATHRGVDEVDTGQYEELAKTAYISGCSMFIRSAVFDKCGLFDSKFYLYYEDFDLCQKASKAGFDLYYVPMAIVWHKNARTSGGTGSDLQSYYMTRNRLLIGMRYAPWRTKLALFRQSLNYLLHGSSTQKQAVGDYIRKNYGQRRSSHWRFPQINLFKFLSHK